MGSLLTTTHSWHRRLDKTTRVAWRTGWVNVLRACLPLQAALFYSTFLKVGGEGWEAEHLWRSHFQNREGEIQGPHRWAQNCHVSSFFLWVWTHASCNPEPKRAAATKLRPVTSDYTRVVPKGQGNPVATCHRPIGDCSNTSPDALITFCVPQTEERTWEMRYDFTIELVSNPNFDFRKHVQNIQFGKCQPKRNERQR